MLLFASIALYLTAVWNKGFQYSPNLVGFLEMTALLALTSYMIIPLSKIVLFPIHLITFGLLSIACYVILFYLVGKYSDLITVKSWIFPGFNLFGVTVQKIALSDVGNLFASAVSTAAIINTLEKIT